MLNCCTPKGHNKDIQSVISKDVSCRIANTLTVEIVRVNLQVPPVPPTDFLSSNVVKVTYFLCVRKNKLLYLLYLNYLHHFNSIVNKIERAD